MNPLARYRDALEVLARPCLRGYESSQGRSFAGGLPRVDEGFVWPCKDGVPLHFVAQIACADVPEWGREEGAMLFFYSNRHWGSSPKDEGHVQVLWQRGTSPAQPPPARSGFFRKPGPKIYRQVWLQFKPSRSFPSYERLGFELDEVAHEEYGEFLAELASPIQIGGYPDPIQSDDMERDCERATGIPRQQWQFWMQMQEMGDQQWGDAGALYWFRHQERIWMVTQCF